MPFQSEKQRRFLHANHPEIAKRWERDYANGGISNHFKLKDGGRTNYIYGGISHPDGRRGFPGGAGTPGGYQADWGTTTTTNGGNGGNGDGPSTPPIHTGPSPAEIAAQKAAAQKKAMEEAQLLARETAIKNAAQKKKKVKHLETISSDQPIGFVETLEDLYGKENIQLAAAVKPEFVKKQSWYTSPLKLKTNLAGMVDPEVDTFKSQIKGGLTIEKYLDLSKKGLIPKSQKERFEKQVLKAIEKAGGFGETFQKNWSTDVVEPTFKGGVLDIDESKLQEKEAEKYLEVAKGGVARKNYYHGGILDINESEEIIDDGGNEIALTDYNAAFDDPNDLSTGVKSLFRAKDGGRIGYANGPPGGGETSLGSGAAYSGGASDRGPRDDPDRFGPTTTTTTTTTPTGDDAREQYISTLTYPKKYQTVETHVPHTDQIVKTQIRDYYDPKGHQKRAPKTKEEKSLLDKIAWGIGIYVTGGAILGYKVPKGVLTAQKILSKRSEINTALKYATKLGLFKEEYTVDQLFEDQVNKYKANAKKRKDKMDEYESLPPGHPDKIALEIELEIGKKPDHLGDDGGSPDLPQVVPIGEEVQEYEQLTPDVGGTLASIRSKQALNAQLQAKWAAEQEAHNQLYMVANRGGLANLFRVKNQ